MGKRKMMSIILVLAIVFTSIPVMSYSVQAKTKAPSFSKKNIDITMGKTKTVKLKNATKKVRWKVVDGRKNVKIVKKFGKNQNKIKIKAKEKGSAVLVAVHGKKIYTLKVVVKDKNAVVPTPTVKPTEEVTTKEEAATEEGKPEYATVTFLGLDNEVICTMKYQKGKQYGSLPKLYVKDYLFHGWRVESNVGKGVKETDICEGNITLYAHLTIVFPAVEETYELIEE